jgi:hypothetical protein
VYLAPIMPAGTFGSDDRGLWQIHFPSQGLPPVDGFWSITMYAVESDGRRFLVDNVLNRYAIGDRTKELTFGPDGSLDIWIGRDDPGGARHANWLPAPAAGPYAIIFRAYLPRSSFLSRLYELPPLTRVPE